MDLAGVIRNELQALADAQRAASMQAYMKSTMPMLGVARPQQIVLFTRIFAEQPLTTARAWQAMCLKIWRNAKYREERYGAIDLTGFRLYRKFQTLETMPMYEETIVSGAWWDFVDPIAKDRLGPLLEKYPEIMRAKMLAWATDDDLWKRRSAILCQLGFKNSTDLAFLHACMEPSFRSKEFFLQKAIGWALRQYAWSNARAVRKYVKQHGSKLSTLSVREALKNID